MEEEFLKTQHICLQIRRLQMGEHLQLCEKNVALCFDVLQIWISLLEAQSSRFENEHYFETKILHSSINIGRHGNSGTQFCLLRPGTVCIIRRVV